MHLLAGHAALNCFVANRDILLHAEQLQPFLQN